MTGVIVAMATPLNLELADHMGLAPDEPTSPEQLLIAVRAEDDAALATAVAAVDAALAERERSTGTRRRHPAPHDRRAASTTCRPADSALAIISVPGTYAVAEAADAIAAGRSVLVFSDGVPVEHEVALKRAAHDAGVLVMGPDCGTAIVSGVALGFANVVRPGPVGPGGRLRHRRPADLLPARHGRRRRLARARRRRTRPEGGGRRAGHARRARRPRRRPRHRAGAARLQAARRRRSRQSVEAAAAELSVPVRSAVLSPETPDLTAAVEALLADMGMDVPTWPSRPGPAESAVPGATLKGLYSGGTLADEAMLIAAPALGGIRSNIPLKPELDLGTDLSASGHVVIDFGDDALTVGRAHPMIDPTLRLEAIAGAGRERRAGRAAARRRPRLRRRADPAGALVPALTAARAKRHLPVVVALVGTEGDPQGWSRQADALAAAGAARLRLQLRRHAVRPRPAGSLPMTLGGLLSAPPAIVAAGVDVFSDALRAQGAEVHDVDWRPPGFGDPADLAAIALDPRRAAANRTAVERVLAAGSQLVDVRPGPRRARTSATGRCCTPARR